MKQQLSILYNGKQSASFPAPPPQRLGEAWDETTAVYLVQWETVSFIPSPSPSKAGGGMG